MTMNRERLFEVFDLHSDDGLLFWKPRPREHFSSVRSWRIWNARFPGKRAGYERPDGYWFVKVDGRDFGAHRVIWLMAYGTEPVAVDHGNGLRSDNRLANLRAVTVTENNRNAKRRKDNKSGVTGVDWRVSAKKWRAQIAVDGRDVVLGYFRDLSEAAAARASAERQYGFHRNHGRTA